MHRTSRLNLSVREHRNPRTYFKHHKHYWQQTGLPGCQRSCLLQRVHFALFDKQTLLKEKNSRIGGMLRVAGQLLLLKYLHLIAKENRRDPYGIIEVVDDHKNGLLNWPLP